jgi:hypothetical protein
MSGPELNGGSSSALDPLAGQFGHLSADQEAKFAEFKAACEKDGVYQPGKTRATLNDDVLLCVEHSPPMIWDIVTSGPGDIYEPASSKLLVL